MNPKKSFYAIIPGNVRYSKNITANAKLLYGEITALCNEKGFCYASNQYFSELYEKEKETISRWISSLEKEGFITSEIDPSQGNSRKIFLSNPLLTKKSRPIDEKINTLLTKKSRPIDEKINTPYNRMNITVNNTINNTDKSLREIFSKIKEDYPIIFESILEGKTFHERIQISLKSDNLPFDFEKNILPILLHWLKSKWTAHDLEKPVNRLRSEATSYILQVMKNGGLNEKKELEEPKPVYLRKIT